MGLFRGHSFSWIRTIGISGVKQSFERKTCIPTSKQGLDRKFELQF